MNPFAVCAAAALSVVLAVACDGTPPAPSPPPVAGWVRLDGCPADAATAARAPVVHHVRIPAERAALEGLEIVDGPGDRAPSACVRGTRG